METIGINSLCISMGLLDDFPKECLEKINNHFFWKREIKKDSFVYVYLHIDEKANKICIVYFESYEDNKPCICWLDENNIELKSSYYNIIRAIFKDICYPDSVKSSIIDDSNRWRFCGDAVIPNWKWRIINKTINSDEKI